MGESVLGAFLRARRARLTPADVGLGPGGHRRTPGLRREEVAARAGISPDYYTLLALPTPGHRLFVCLPPPGAHAAFDGLAASAA